MLTAKQKELLLYIHERIKETGVSPSFDEMKEALRSTRRGQERSLGFNTESGRSHRLR